MLQSILASLRPAIVALIASAGLSILFQAVFNDNLLTLKHLNWIEAILFLSAFFVLRKFKWNPILVMSLCGIGRLILGLLLE